MDTKGIQASQSYISQADYYIGGITIKESHYVMVQRRAYELSGNESNAWKIIHSLRLLKSSMNYKI